MEKNERIYKEQQKLSFLGFLLELPNFVAVAITALITNSLISWVDFLESLANVISCGFIAVLSKRLRRDLRYKYNYGIGKIEAIASLCCYFFLFIGLISIVIFSINQLIHPVRPSDLLFLAVFLKIINVLFDTYFVLQQRKIKKNSNSRIADSEYRAVKHDWSFDFTALVLFIICYFLRDYTITWYLTPVSCLILSAYFFKDCVIEVRDAAFELMDKTLPEEQQMIILKSLTAHYEEYEELFSVNSRQNGDKIIIDIHVRFSDKTTYKEMLQLCQDISDDIKSEIENAVVSIVIEDVNTK